MNYSEPKSDHNLERFCESLCAGQAPIWISVKPPSYAQIGHCYENVEKRIKQKGGMPVFGWEISNLEDLWLEAQFHCIWKSPKGELVDLTPEQFGRNRVLFLKDNHRVYNGIPIDFRRFLIEGNDQDKVQEAWSLQDQISAENDSLLNQGIDPQSQLGVSLIQPKLHEYKTLLSELKNRTNRSEQ
ncbi:hypothetical protein ACWPKO_03090 [Coraliomargarita sp. W4R53]